MPRERVLICGAGIAGSICAYWLGNHDFDVVVIERSKSEQKAGQGLEIEEPALSVVRSMGIIPQLEQVRTGEKGFTLVDSQGHKYGTLESGYASPTGALEIMRGELTEVLYKAANQYPDVDYRFETVISSLRQTRDKAIVELESRKDSTISTEEFDLVIGADGARSRTRQLAMGSPDELNCYKRVGAYVAYFSIDKEPHDWPYSELCHFPGRKVVWKRPVGEHSNTSSVYLIHVHDDIPDLRRANAAGDRQGQKEAIGEIYKGLGWETPRIIQQMMKTDNFYSDDLTQVKLKTWSKDRVVLTGDAAWAPTPFTGEGNQLAIIGSFVLAQELSRNRNAAAFGMYEKRFRSYVEAAQEIPLYGYAPYLCAPETAWGIWVFRTLFGLMARILSLSYFSNKSANASTEDKHPKFDLEM